MYDIDRKTAGRLLKMSIRTVDRYISAQKLSHEKRDGRIWLDKKEIMQIKARNRVDRVDTGIDRSASKMSIDKMDLIPVDMSIDSEGNSFHAVESEDGTIEVRESARKQEERTQNQNQAQSRQNFGRNRGSRMSSSSSPDELEIYKKLYEQLQAELKEKEQRLEMANYHMGQLEARIKESVPLLDYKRDLAGEQAEKQQLRKDLDGQIMELDMSMNNFREERFNKRIYLILLFILLLLQPLWFLFPPK